MRYSSSSSSSSPSGGVFDRRGGRAARRALSRRASATRLDSCHVLQCLRIQGLFREPESTTPARSARATPPLDDAGERAPDVDADADAGVGRHRSIRFDMGASKRRRVRRASNAVVESLKAAAGDDADDATTTTRSIQATTEARMHKTETDRYAPAEVIDVSDDADADADRRARWRELACEALCERAPEKMEMRRLATTLRTRSKGWDEETKATLGWPVKDFEMETRVTLRDLERRGVVESSTARSNGKRRKGDDATTMSYGLVKGVAEAMREMNGAILSDSDVEIVSEVEGGKKSGAIKRSASQERFANGQDDSDDNSDDSDSDDASEDSEQSRDDDGDDSGDDHHDDIDDSFDEYTDDDGEEDNHNFSFNLETEPSDSERGDGDDDSLHAQVLEFMKHSEMTEREERQRQHVFDTIQAAISKQYATSNCSLHVFGSGATGLALAGADLDLVLLGIGPESRKGGGGGFSRSEREEIVRHLRKMANYLRRVNAVSRAELIATAKVPIVKMKSASPPYIAVDLSLGTSNGLEAVDWIRDQVKTYKALRPLVFFLKRLLSTHHLNDAATGGCGGYLLVSLVVSHLKQTGPVEVVNKPGLFGDLLVGFLRRFGSAFDYRVNAVAAGRESGVMSASQLPGPPFGARPYIMAEDPQERLRCFTAAAFRFREVQNLFRLTAEHIMVSGELSLLSEVAAPPPRNIGYGAPRTGQLIKIKKGSLARHSSSGNGGRQQNHYFRKKNAANSFSVGKPDWTDDPRNSSRSGAGGGKRPRAANAWSSDGHKGFGGEPKSPAKRQRLSAAEFAQRAKKKNSAAPKRTPSSKAKPKPTPKPKKKGNKKRPVRR